MEKFLELLDKSKTDYQRISDNEICIECISIAATEEQGDKLPSDKYLENPLISDSEQIHLVFNADGSIDWSVVSMTYGEG